MLEMPQLSSSSEVAPGGAGDESDDSRLDRASRRAGQLQDSKVQGIDNKGPTRSEVIVGAAESGFVSTPYRKVYTDYRDHAEDVLEKEEIPGGYRYYVRRYFQLIRPRDTDE